MAWEQSGSPIPLSGRCFELRDKHHAEAEIGASTVGTEAVPIRRATILAVAESFFKSLKTEVIYGNKLLDKKQMKILLFEYIEIWYNKKRRHSYLNYQTIEEFNRKQDKQKLKKTA